MDENVRSIIEQELHAYGLAGAAAEPIREKGGVFVARVRTGDGPRILKAFEDLPSRREIGNYKLLASLGVPVLRIDGCTDRSLLMEDIEASPILRLGTESDIHDGDVIRALARWYRTLHERGEGYVRENGSGMYDEWDLFTSDGIDLLKVRLGKDFEVTLEDIKARFGDVRRRMDEAPKTLCYNDFYYTNMAVAKDKSHALMFDYNLLGKGCCINDIMNVTYWFTPEERELFISEYGGIDEELAALQREISPVITLISAVRRGIFPDWAKEAENELAALGSVRE